MTPLVGLAFAFLHAGQREGWPNTVRMLALVFGVSLVFESAGVATGWIYGPYHYTDRLSLRPPVGGQGGIACPLPSAYRAHVTQNRCPSLAISTAPC